MERYADDEMEERRSIRNSGKALKKYGSTSKHIKRNEIMIKHVVSKSDTLQGIALKFGVTVSIFDENKIFRTLIFIDILNLFLTVNYYFVNYFNIHKSFSLI